MKVPAMSRDHAMVSTEPSSLESLGSSFVDCAHDELKVPQAITRVCNALRLKGRHSMDAESDDERKESTEFSFAGYRGRPRSESRRTASTDVTSDSEASTGCPSVTGRGMWRPTTSQRHRLDVILDLDRTLVNSFEVRKAGPSESENVTPILQEVYRDEFDLPELYLCVISDVKVLTKIRPHARAFLRELVSNTDSEVVVSIYTKGARRYMEVITQMLDPSGELIKGRMVSRDDEPPNMTAVEKDPDFIIDASAEDAGALSDGRLSITGAASGPVRSSKLRRWFVVLDDSPEVWPEEFREAGNIVAAATYDFAEINYQPLMAAAATAPEGGRAQLLSLPRDNDDFLEWEAPERIWGVRDELCRAYGYAPSCRSSDACSTDDSEPPTPSTVAAQLKSSAARSAKRSPQQGFGEAVMDGEEMGAKKDGSRKRMPRRRSVASLPGVIDCAADGSGGDARRKAVPASRGKCGTVAGFPLRFVIFVAVSLVIIMHEMLYAPAVSRPAMPATMATPSPLSEDLTDAAAVEADEEIPSFNTTESVPAGIAYGDEYGVESATAAASHLRQGITTARPAEDVPYYLV
ncbi:RNA polymerase II [Perkinsus olseni]|uniref:protein-serine/threonine phosphatase n=1 Tax=Perkinsus olseni TaxID=32597 RepID=A0A7J6PGV2_PEROL|nr:RNA polymerase II [Perkinsus olseni]